MMSPTVTTPGAPGEDIAIVGMACLFPGAASLAEFWQNVVEGRSAIGDPPADWGDGQKSYDPDSSESDRVYCLRGGYLGDLARFDPLEHGIMPRAVDGAEPEHFLALRVAAAALADAGYPDVPIDRDRTEVILGRGTFVNRALMSLHQHGTVVQQTLDILRQLLPDADEAFLGELRSRLRARLPPFDPLTAGGVVSSIMSGRIANRLDLKGTNYCLDAACASSLLAVERGIEDLRAGRCDAVIAGGVQLAANHLVLMVFSQLGALSRRSDIRPFDAGADGTLLGEGVGMVVLKRREVAERDGNRIYALVRGVGSASDGRAKSILAPRAEGQELALRRAYENAGVVPDTVTLMEAHGTGIPLGDATELESLRRVFGESSDKTCAIGSVKSMIGHLIPASGMAGLIKTALALYHRTLPPSIACDEVSPDLEAGPFYVNTKTRPWVHGSSRAPRRAGVSAFGFGGINAHAVLEEYGAEGTETLVRRWPGELCLLTADSRAELVVAGERLRRFLDRSPGAELADVAFTLHREAAEAAGRRPSRLAIVAGSTAELGRKLDHALERLRDPRRTRIRERSGIFYFDERLAEAGKVAFLFPGEGSQYPGMLADLCLHFPEVRACFDTAERALAGAREGLSLAREVFPPPTVPGSKGELAGMVLGVQAVTTANRALFGLVRRLGLSPDAMVGHSSGEFGALEASGMLKLEHGESGLVDYIRAGVASVRGVAAAARALAPVQLVATSPDDPARVYDVVARTNGRVRVTMDNCPLQVVLCGAPEDVSAVTAELKGEGIACSELPFHRPYHSAAFDAACGPLREFFSKLDLGPPRCPVYSCATAAPFNGDLQVARELAVQQWTRPVRFRETIEALYADGARLFVEVGPSAKLSAFTSDTLRRRPHVAVALDRQHRSGITELLTALGLLAAHGVSMDLGPLFERRSRERLDLDGEVGERREPPVLPLALPRLELDGDDMAALGPLAPRAGAGHERAEDAGAARPDLQPVMTSYLETMRDFLRVQERALEVFGVPSAGEVEAAGKTLGTPSTSTPAEGSGQRRLPFAGEIVSRHADESVVRRVLDVDDDLFLLDHALGGRVSLRDPSLRPLAVMPLTMSLEMAAEAAQVLAPGRTVIGLRDVRAHRWIALTSDRVALLLAARRTGVDLVRVEVREEGAEGPEPPILEGTVRFGASHPVAPSPVPFVLDDSRPSRFTAERVYRTGMFSGPAFQGVESVERWAPGGASATLRARPARGLFRSLDDPELLIDPIVLDAVGQVAAHWNAEAHSSGFNFFPYALEALDVFGPALAPGSRAACHMRIEPLDSSRFRADFEVLAPDGRLHMKLVGWEDKSFALPEAFWGIRAGAPDGAFTTDWPLSLSGALPADAFCCRAADSFEPSLLLGSGRLWAEVLARQVLSRREREEWQARGAPDRASLAELLGRVAAKDAVRLLLRRRHGLELCPADVEVHLDPGGRHRAGGEWTRQVPPPSISITHAGDVAVAVAADGEAGIDVASGRIEIEVERAGGDLEPIPVGLRLKTPAGDPVGHAVPLTTEAEGRRT